MEDRMVQQDTLISTSCKESLRLFRHLLAKLEDATSRSPELGLSHWKDEYGRLKVWAGNIGAHLVGQASLDFRLRDAIHIKRHILDLLQDLCQTIRDTEDILTDPELPGYDLNPGFPTYADSPETELQQIHREVVTIIGCLLQTSMLVRNPAYHSLLTESQPTDISAFEHWDRDHVRSSFPEASEALVERLGAGLTQRRKRLKYRERHRMKLGLTLDGEEGDDLTSDNLSRLSDTIATDYKMQGLDFGDLSTRSESSQTTSVASFISGSTSATIPARPKESNDGKPFECPYCFYVITVNDTRSWIKHVFNDLQPYICPFLDCPLPYKLYSSQREWINHLNSVHGNVLSSITAENDDRKHPSGLRCPLCDSSFDSSKTFEHHVARHLQELALFVLPRGEEDSSDERSMAEGDLASNDSAEQMDVDQEQPIIEGDWVWNSCSSYSLNQENLKFYLNSRFGSHEWKIEV